MSTSTSPLFESTATLTEPQKDCITLGVIEFINTVPIYFGLNTTDLPIQTYVTNPVHLNTLMANNELNVSPVSSAYYLRNKNKYILLEDLSVSSYGSVDSVLLLSKQPLSHFKSGQTIAIPSDSETSIALLKHMLQQESSAQLEFMTYTASNYQQAFQQHDGVLIIGDRALLSQPYFESQQAYCTDLSRWWVDKTGLPFVFAVWIANKQWATKNPEKLKQINQLLADSKKNFLNNTDLLEQALTYTSKRCDLSKEKIKHYWHQSLNYDLTLDHKQALNLFGSVLAAADASEKSCV